MVKRGEIKIEMSKIKNIAFKYIIKKVKGQTEEKNVKSTTKKTDRKIKLNI